MRRLLVLTAAVLVSAAVACSAEPDVNTWGEKPPAPDVVVQEVRQELVSDDVPVLGTKRFKDGLTIRQRREMGLTLRNVTRIVKELDEAGEITEDTTVEEAAVMVLSVLVEDTPAAFQDPAIDWEAILAFLERLLPLILQIIAIFT